MNTAIKIVCLLIIAAGFAYTAWLDHLTRKFDRADPVWPQDRPDFTDLKED